MSDPSSLHVVTFLGSGNIVVITDEYARLLEEAKEGASLTMPQVDGDGCPVGYARIFIGRESFAVEALPVAEPMPSTPDKETP